MHDQNERHRRSTGARQRRTASLTALALKCTSCTTCIVLAARRCNRAYACNAIGDRCASDIGNYVPAGTVLPGTEAQFLLPNKVNCCRPISAHSSYLGACMLFNAFGVGFMRSKSSENYEVRSAGIRFSQVSKHDERQSPPRCASICLPRDGGCM